MNYRVEFTLGCDCFIVCEFFTASPVSEPIAVSMAAQRVEREAPQWDASQLMTFPARVEEIAV